MNPTIEDLKVFLQVFAALDEFEAHCRTFRGYGAFPKERELPDPSVMRVVNWLKETEAAGVVDSSLVLNLDNMALHGRVAFLQSELHAAARQFLFYADNHAKKNPPDCEKARANADWAERMLRAGASVDKHVNNGEN